MAKAKTETATKPKSSAAAVAREPRTSSIAGWSPTRLTQADAQCKYGNYALAADLCEAMFSDERVGKCQNRLYSATTLPIAFKLPGLDAEQSKKDPVCVALETDWWLMLPEQTMRTAVRWLSLFGAFLAHIDGWRMDPETGRVLPIVTPWSPRNLRNDAERGYQVSIAQGFGTYSSEWTDITPGNGEWILIVAGSDWRAPYQSPWRGISRWWLLGKLYSPVDWATSSERHGQGEHFVENTMSSGSGLDSDTGDTLNKQEKAEVASQISEMGRNGVCVLPRGWTAKLVTDGANTFQTFKTQTEFANMAIDIGLTGTNLTTEVSGGSFAAASVHATVDAGVIRGLLELIATGIREQVIVHWQRFNFAAGIAPYPSWDTTPPADKKSEAEARKADADALKTYREAGAQLNQKSWFEGKVELVKSAGEEFPEKPAPVAPVAAPAPVKKAMAQATATETAFAKGRAYTDDLETNLCSHAAKGLASTLAGVLSIIDSAEGYSDAQDKLREFYAGKAAPSELLKLTEAALIMAELAGKETVEIESVTEE